MKKRSLNAILISVSLLFISACAPLVKPEQPAHSDWLTLDPEHSVGQTFSVSYAGLQGIAILLEPGSAVEGSLELNLFAIDQRDIPLKTVSLPLRSIDKSGFQQFAFQPIPLSKQQDYFFRLTFQGEGNLRVGIGPGASYLNGAAYFDVIAQDQQTVFRLVYSPGIAGRGLVLEGIEWFFRLALGGLLFIAPGWGALTYLFPPWRRLFWVEKISLASGVSLAIYPLLLLWTDLVGLHLGVFMAWIPILGGVGAIFWQLTQRPPRLTRVRNRSLSDILCNLAYVIGIALILFTRFWPIRGLAAPLWGDSLQHTMISQLIVDHKGLFTSWAPYAELTSFSYHFGFHTLVAAFHWMTGLEMAQAVLWVGQIINVLSLLVLVPLANRLSRNHWAGLIALATAGLLTSIPQIYINWGRYTQLAGQVILPVFIYISWVFLSEHADHRPLAGMTAVLLAGLALTHSRVLILALAFLLALFCAYLRPVGFRKLFKSLLTLGVASLILYSPWLARILPSNILQFFVAQVSAPASQLTAPTTPIASVLQYAGMIPDYLWWLSGAGLLLALWRRDKAMGIFTVWCLLGLLLGNPHWIGLPGSDVIGSFTVMIAAYIPVAVMAGYLIAKGVEQLKKITPAGTHSSFAIGLTILSLAASLVGLRPRLGDVQVMASALFTHPDQRAAEWITKNLPEDSLFLINSFLAYENTVAVGSDGGWWLPVKARRAVTVPPINYSLENEPRPGYRKEVNEVTAAILEKGITDPEVQRLLDERGVTHVYLGQQQGSVNYAGPPISAEQLLTMDAYRPIYHEDRVWIFERKRP